MSAFLVSSFTTESMVSEFVVKFMTADAWGIVGEDWKSEFASER